MVVFLTKSFSKYNKSIELTKFRLEICHRKFGHFGNIFVSAQDRTEDLARVKRT